MEPGRFVTEKEAYQNCMSFSKVTKIGMQQLYAKEALTFYGSIPVFSTTNIYTENYEKISADHLISLQKNATNPFIPEDLWIKMERSTVALVQKYSRAGDMILDVGVGLGRLLSHFPDLQKYGLDISYDYLQKAQEKGIEVCYALIEDMPYRKELFDIVVCTDVLEHVLDLNLCIQKILSVLKPEGTLIVRVPFREDLAPYTADDCGYEFVHLRNFDEHSLRLLFEKIMNCKMIETTYAAYIPSASRLKYTLVAPLFNRIAARFFWEARRFWGMRLNDIVLKVLFYPAEINCVIRK